MRSASLGRSRVRTCWQHSCSRKAFTPVFRSGPAPACDGAGVQVEAGTQQLELFVGIGLLAKWEGSSVTADDPSAIAPECAGTQARDATSRQPLHADARSRVPPEPGPVPRRGRRRRGRISSGPLPRLRSGQAYWSALDIHVQLDHASNQRHPLHLGRGWSSLHDDSTIELPFVEVSDAPADAAVAVDITGLVPARRTRAGATSASASGRSSL